ncbi:hypothetical protein [Pseudomonas graminis]
MKNSEKRFDFSEWSLPAGCSNKRLNPLNLIDLVEMAREEQIRADARTPRTLEDEKFLIAPDAIKAAQLRLSAQRVEGTLMAEAGVETASHIDKFRGAKEGLK